MSTEDEHETLLELTLAIDCPGKKREGTPLVSDSNSMFSSSSSIEYGGPENNEWFLLHATDHVMVRSFDRIDKEHAFGLCNP